LNGLCEMDPSPSPAEAPPPPTLEELLRAEDEEALTLADFDEEQ